MRGGGRYLSVLSQYARGDFRVLLDELEDRVGHDVGSGAGEVHQSLEARIWLAQDTMSVAGDDLAGLEGGPEVILDVCVGELVAD